MDLGIVNICSTILLIFSPLSSLERLFSSSWQSGHQTKVKAVPIAISEIIVLKLVNHFNSPPMNKVTSQSIHLSPYQPLRHHPVFLSI